MKKISAKIKYKTKVKIKINGPHICKICGNEYKSASGIASHILNKHDGMLYGDYLLNYLGIDFKKINSEWEKKSDERTQIQKDGLKKAQKVNKGIPIKKRLTENQYNNFRKKMRGVFSLAWYINKYGEIDGTNKYNKRCEKISKSSHFHKYNASNKMNWSDISQKLFWEIYDKIKDKYNKIYFGELNHEFSCGIPQCNFDFVVKDIKRVIEFNGDKFHANPAIYNSNEIPLKFINKKSKDIWKEDEVKIQKAFKKGYDIKIVWERDYINNEEGVLLECLNFLKHNKNETNKKSKN